MWELGGLADSGQIGDAGKWLQTYYFQEVGANLDKIEQSLKNLGRNGNDPELVTEIVDASQAIEDLAMIHGYEGVEAIAHKMETAVRGSYHRAERLPQDFLRKLEIAVIAIRKVVDLCDEMEERIIVDSTTSQMKTIGEAVQFAGPEAKEAEKEVPVAEKPAIRPEQKAGELLFDIKEVKSLMSLMSEEDMVGEGSEASLGQQEKVEEIKKKENVPPEIKREEEKGSSEIKQVFHDIFREDAKQTLDFLKVSIDKVNEGDFSKEGMEKIRHGCSTLRELAQQMGMEHLQVLLTPLEELVQEKFKEDSRPAEEVLSLLSEVESVIRAEVENSDGHHGQFDGLVSRIDSLLKPEKVSVEEGIDDEILLRLQNQLRHGQDRVSKRGFANKIKGLFSRV